MLQRCPTPARCGLSVLESNLRGGMPFMKNPKHQPEREEQAKREIGHTAIHPEMARFVTAAFLVLISFVPLFQCASNLLSFSRGERDHPWPSSVDFLVRSWHALCPLLEHETAALSRVVRSNRNLLREMRDFENALDDELAIANLARPHAQFFLSRALGAGNELTYCGRDGWLFYAPDADYLLAPGFLDALQQERRLAKSDEWLPPPQPDPVKAVIEFNRRLAERGITFIVMPTPVKPSIHPEKLSRACDQPEPLQNMSYSSFVRQLEKEGVLVFDCAEALRDAALEAGPQYLKTDTHWRPETVELVAELLARFVRQHVPLPEMPATSYERCAAIVSRQGDIAAMLKLPTYQDYYRPEQATIRRVMAPDGSPWTPDESSDVLVLGDSFSNIYSQEALGWGENAGLIEQLSFELRRPLDRIVRNDNGAFSARAALGRELARGKDRLAGKRVVIHQFAARELAHGDWKLVDLSLGRPVSERFLVPDAGARLAVRGVIAHISPAPRPGSVPYRDHIICAHVVDIRSADGSIADAQAVIYMQSMINDVRTRAAGLRPGDMVELTLRPWADVAAKYEGINRSELEDESLLLQEPCWGELL